MRKLFTFFIIISIILSLSSCDGLVGGENPIPQIEDTTPTIAPVAESTPQTDDTTSAENVPATETEPALPTDEHTCKYCGKEMVHFNATCCRRSGYQCHNTSCPYPSLENDSNPYTEFFGEYGDHTFLEEWKHDDTYHWHVCTSKNCEEVSGKAKHNFGEYNEFSLCQDCGAPNPNYVSHTNNENETQSGSQNTHTHTFSEGWGNDDTHHWHVCTGTNCEEVSDKAEHTWDEGKVTIAATCTTEGKKEYKCTVCNATKTEKIPTTEHDFGNWVQSEDRHSLTWTCGCGESKTEEYEVTFESNWTEYDKYQQYFIKITQNGSPFFERTRYYLNYSDNEYAYVSTNDTVQGDGYKVEKGKFTFSITHKNRLFTITLDSNFNENNPANDWIADNLSGWFVSAVAVTE